jgi:hypothetical protein
MVLRGHLGRMFRKGHAQPLDHDGSANRFCTANTNTVVHLGVRSRCQKANLLVDGLQVRRHKVRIPARHFQRTVTENFLQMKH